MRVFKLHRINLKGCVDRGFYYYGTLKSTFRIQTHSEIDTSTTSGHPLSFLFNEPLEFHWIRQWKFNFKVRPAQPCPTSPFCHIEICLHSAWQCGLSFEFERLTVAGEPRSPFFAVPQFDIHGSLNEMHQRKLFFWTTEFFLWIIIIKIGT